MAVNTVSKWRKRFVEEGLSGLGIASGRTGRAAFPSVVIEVKAIACEQPAVRAVPLGRWSLAELRDEVITTGQVDQVSVATLWRWLDQDALKPWRHRSWIFPRDPRLRRQGWGGPGLVRPPVPGPAFGAW